MSRMKAELVKRNVPALLAPSRPWTVSRRREALDLLAANVFGRRLPDPVRVEFRGRGMDECRFEGETCDPAMVAYFRDSGRAEYTKVRINSHLPPDGFPGLASWPDQEGQFAFDADCYFPKVPEGQKVPAVVAINYREAMDPRYLPFRDIMERGVAVFAFRYRHVVNDYPERDWPEFDQTGLDRLYYGDYRLRDNPASREGDAPGTVAMWSWAASRVMDYVRTRGDRIDLGRVAVSGHSRLGKTALFTGAHDTRFAWVLSNASCAAGAALSRGDRKQDLRAMSEWHGQWFCENLKTRHNDPSFDMHFMLACVAPRKLYVGNSDQDHCCDEYSEYLSCVAASEAYESLGLKGFVHPDRLPETGDRFAGGDIAYHLRPGAHAFLAEDWMKMLDFMLDR